MSFPDLQGKPQKARAGECYGIYREHHKGGSKSASAHPDEDQQAEDIALARELSRKEPPADRRRMCLQNLLAKYGKRGLTRKGCGGGCACDHCKADNYGVTRRDAAEDAPAEPEPTV